MKKWLYWLVLVLGILSFTLLSCSGSGSVPPVETEISADVSEEGRAIVLGDISDDPAEVIDGTQPLADYLAERGAVCANRR